MFGEARAGGERTMFGEARAGGERTMKTALVLLVMCGLASAGPSAVDATTVIGPALTWARVGVGVPRTATEFQASFNALTTFDNNCMDLTPATAPQLPASCAGPSSACGKCYQEAIHDLNGMRLNLERLRCYYTAYKRYVDASLAFGDNASGIHAVTGLAWQSQRGDIVREMDNLTGIARNKASQMMPNLEAALKKVGTCEEEFFHEADWYQRFGYIYYSFM